MDERFIVIYPTPRQEFTNNGVVEPLKSYEELTKGYTRGLKLTLLQASLLTEEISDYVLGVIIRIKTNIESLDPKLFKTDKENIEWEDLRNKITEARTKLPGKKIFIDCGRWLDEVEKYIRDNNTNKFFNDVELQNDGFGIKRSLLKF